MKLNCNSFFPQFGKFNEINLNAEWLKKGINKNPKSIDRWLSSLDKCTYGGYGEYRGDIWKGTYLDKNENYIHLGIDINVPCGSPIYSPFRCKLVEYFKNNDTDMGWGLRYILEKKDCPYLLVLGHLTSYSYLNSNKYILDCDRYMRNGIHTGELIGYVGTSPDNGNVFSHLHVQCIQRDAINNFDGYGFKKDLKNNPNPFEIEF